MNIDPRLVTTPIGAAIGVLVARRILDKKDHTAKNMLIGGGLGAGAGLLTGQYLKGEPGDISTPEGHLRYLETHKPTGDPSKQEILATDKLLPKGMYGDIPARGGNVANRLARRSIRPVAAEYQTAKTYRAREQGYRYLANHAKHERNKKVFLDLAERSAVAADELEGRVSLNPFMSPLDSTYRSLASIFSKN